MLYLIKLRVKVILKKKNSIPTRATSELLRAWEMFEILINIKIREDKRKEKQKWTIGKVNKNYGR